MRKGKLTDDMFGPSIESPADEIVNDAWDAETPSEMVRLARKALSIDLDAIDAYNILGIHAQTLAERIALFREADLIGERLFAPLLSEEDMAWWGYIGTRPFMRARQNLGLALLEAGDLEGAMTALKSLLQLNPNDNQGVRYILMAIAGGLGKYDECKLLLAQYPDESSIEFPSARLLIEMSKAKPGKSLSKILADVAESNAHFLPALKRAAATGKWPVESRGDFVTFGSKSQANDCIAQFKKAWTRTPRILENFLALPEISKL